MKRIVFLLFTLIPILTYTQNTFNIRTQFGQPFANLTSVFPTDSCYYATGVITDTVGPYKIGNIFVKLDLNGDTLFTKRLLNPNIYYQTWRGDLIQTNDNLLADVGIMTDTLLKAFFVKYDLNGDTVFTKSFINPYYPGDSFITTVDLSRIGESDYLLVGGINSDMDNAEGDILVLRLDSLGNVLNESIFGSQMTEIGGKVITEEDGYIIGACRTNSNQVSKNFIRRTYLFKVDSLTNIEWEYLSPQSTIQNTAKGLVKADDGGLVVATSRGFEHPINTNNGQLRWESAYFFKLDEQQDIVWELEVFDSITPVPSQGIEKLIKVDSGNAYVAAGHFGLIRSTDPPIGGTYGWVIKFSDNGDLIWVRKHQIVDILAHKHEINDLKPTPDGGFIVVGKAQSDNNDPIAASQAWILKLDEDGCLIPGCGDVVNTQNEAASIFELAIHPNPTTDYLNFQLRTHKAMQTAHFRIVDANGQTVKEIESNLPKGTNIVPVYNWASGIYFLQYMEDGQVQHSEKFIIQ